MEGLRVLLAATFFGLAALALFLFSFEDEGLSVADAALVPVGDGFALTTRIENGGGPDRLIGIASDSAASTVMTAELALAVPAGGAASLSMDGVHGMLSGLIGGREEGRLVAVSLWFERAGKVTTRARIGAAQRDHGASYDVPDGEPMPDVHVYAEPDGDGWRVEVITEGFTFSEEAVGGPHQPGVGHGHLYLNGLKLQRIYGPEARIGSLPAGTHEIRVTLNTNDHRAYSVGGGLVTSAAEIVVD